MFLRWEGNLINVELDVDITPRYRVSWQARTINTLLRTAVKPVGSALIRSRRSLESIYKLDGFVRRMPARVPPSVTIDPASSGEWVRWGDDLDEERAVLYLHGGGYFCCSPATHRAITWRLSRSAACPLLAIDYRQGPEHPISTSLEDAITAYQGLLEHGHRDIVIAGDSAGGHLTLATLLALRDRGMPMPRAGICLSPWADLSLPPKPRGRSNRWLDPMLPAGRIGWLAGLWSDGLDPYDPLVSPVYGDYAGLPPLMIITGSTEVLRDEGRRVADQARNGGVPVTYEEWPSMPHVFAIFADYMPEARMVFRHMERFLKAVSAASPAAGQTIGEEPAA